MDVETWKREHPSGTPVVFRRVDGCEIQTVTTSPAIRYGMAEVIAVACIESGTVMLADVRVRNFVHDAATNPPVR